MLPPIEFSGSRYNVLGLSATIEDYLFKVLDPNSVAAALMENIQTMEFRHIRQLVHSTLVPMVKCCPADMWDRWLEKLLHPLLIHSQRALGISWSSLLQEGRAKVPDLHGIQAGSDLKVEVIEEKLLRDLTREICSLLSVLASPGLNPGLPSLEQSGHFSRAEVSSLRNLESFTSSTMVGYAFFLVIICRCIFLKDIDGWGLYSFSDSFADFCLTIKALQCQPFR